MKRLFITLFAIVLATSSFAIDEKNVTVIAKGWSNEYAAKIHDAKAYFVSALNQNELLHNITTATLTVTYKDGKCTCSLEIPYVSDLVKTSPQLIGYYHYGSNGFSSTSIATIFDIMGRTMFKVGYEGLSVNRTFVTGNYWLILNKDSKNRAAFSGHSYWSQYPAPHPQLDIDQEFGLTVNGKKYLYHIPYKCLHEYGYIFGGDIQDKLSGKVVPSAKAFETFFQLSEEDREAIRREKEKELYAIEETEMNNINDSIYDNMHPRMGIDWGFTNNILVSSKYWQNQMDFTGKFCVVVDRNGKIQVDSLATYEDDISEVEWELAFAIADNMFCKKVANRYFKAHDKRINVNSTVNFTVRLEHEKYYMDEPLAVSYKYNDKDSTVVITNEKAIRGEFVYPFKLSRLKGREDELLKQLESVIADSSLPLDNKKHKIEVNISECRLSLDFTDYNDHTSTDCGFVFSIKKQKKP